MRTNPVKQKYVMRFFGQTYDAKVHHINNPLRNYSAQYTVKKDKLSVKRSPFAPNFSKFLTADHSKSLLGLVDSLMPQDVASAQNDGGSVAQQEETSPNEM
jgi:hypothetical protein